MAEYNQASMAPPPLTAMIFDLLLPTFSLHLPKSNLIVQALSLLDLAKADTIATTTKSHYHGGHRPPLSLSLSLFSFSFLFFSFWLIREFRFWHFYLGNFGRGLGMFEVWEGEFWVWL